MFNIKYGNNIKTWKKVYNIYTIIYSFYDFERSCSRCMQLFHSSQRKLIIMNPCHTIVSNFKPLNFRWRSAQTLQDALLWFILLPICLCRSWRCDANVDSDILAYWLIWMRFIGYLGFKPIHFFYRIHAYCPIDEIVMCKIDKIISNTNL